MLNLSFAGTLGRDPETRAAGQSEVTEFSVAVNGYDRRAKEKTTTWLKVNIWGARGAQLAGMLEKGQKVAGAGQLEIQSYTNREGETKLSYVVTVQDLTLMGGGAPREERAQPAKREPAKSGKAKAPAQDDFPFDSEDDIPF